MTIEKPDESSSSRDGSGGSSSELKDAFESELDKAFIRFSTRLGHNPEQVLRYEFGGVPLLYSYGDAVGKRVHGPMAGQGHDSNAKVKTVTSGGIEGQMSIPPCEYCSGERVFEMQLVPHAISVLEESKGGLDGMEWGTIILGVCSHDCGPKEVGDTVWREEWAGVQWEEVQ